MPGHLHWVRVLTIIFPSYSRGVSVVLLEDRIAAAHCLAPLLENATNLRSLALGPVDALLKAEPRIGYTFSSWGHRGTYHAQKNAQPTHGAVLVLLTTIDPYFLGAPAEDIFEATLRAVRHTAPHMLSFGIIADPGMDYPFWERLAEAATGLRSLNVNVYGLMIDPLPILPQYLDESRAYKVAFPLCATFAVR